jgi:hypothetical protein
MRPLSSDAASIMKTPCNLPIVVGEQPKEHAGFIARDDGSRSCDDGHATTTRSEKPTHY